MWCKYVDIREYPIRPVERAVASWPEGDGAGMCKRSSWPDVSVSAQVVDVSGRGARGSLGSGRSAGCAIGEGRTSPRLGAMAGICSGRIPGGLLPLLGSPDRRRHASDLPAGFSPARRVASGARKGVRVRANSGCHESYVLSCACRHDMHGAIPKLHSKSCGGLSQVTPGLSQVHEPPFGGTRSGLIPFQRHLFNQLPCHENRSLDPELQAGVCER